MLAQLGGAGGAQVGGAGGQVGGAGGAEVRGAGDQRNPAFITLQDLATPMERSRFLVWTLFGVGSSLAVR